MTNKVFEFLNRPSTKLERNGFDRSFRSVFSVKAMVFPVVMYGYESWTVKKAEC